jgi:hypothetical protein
MAGDAQTAAQIIPERKAMLGTSLGKPKEGIPAIAPEVAASSCAELAAGHLTADVVLGAIDMQRDFWSLEHHQQFGFVGVEPLQQSIQHDEAGAATEDAIEPRAAPDGEFCQDRCDRP